MPNLEQYQRAHERELEYWGDFSSKAGATKALASHVLRYFDFPSFTTGAEAIPTTTTESYVVGVNELLSDSRIPEEIRTGVLNVLGEKVGSPSLATDLDL